MRAHLFACVQRRWRGGAGTAVIVGMYLCDLMCESYACACHVCIGACGNTAACAAVHVQRSPRQQKLVVPAHTCKHQCVYTHMHAAHMHARTHTCTYTQRTQGTQHTRKCKHARAHTHTCTRAHTHTPMFTEAFNTCQSCELHGFLQGTKF